MRGQDVDQFQAPLLSHFLLPYSRICSESHCPGHSCPSVDPPVPVVVAAAWSPSPHLPQASLPFPTKVFFAASFSWGWWIVIPLSITLGSLGGRWYTSEVIVFKLRMSLNLVMSPL